MAKYILFFLVFLGICGLLLPELANGWGWGGGGWRPPRDRPGGGGGGGGGTPPAPPPGSPGGGARPGAATPGTPGSPDKSTSDEQMNQEFDFEYVGDKEIDYHRQVMANLFANRK